MGDQSVARGKHGGQYLRCPDCHRTIFDDHDVRVVGDIGAAVQNVVNGIPPAEDIWLVHPDCDAPNDPAHNQQLADFAE